MENVSGPVEIKLYDALGQELDSFNEEINSETLTIPLSKVPPGFVIIRITGEDFSELVKIKKQ